MRPVQVGNDDVVGRGADDRPLREIGGAEEDQFPPRGCQAVRESRTIETFGLSVALGWRGSVQLGTVGAPTGAAAVSARPVIGVDRTTPRSATSCLSVAT